jgi:hypothetical protein
MQAYRYNSDRSHRKYNNCGMEKNPNAVKFYASNMAYADNYKFIYSDAGEVVAECSLEVVEIEGVNLFDMSTGFQQLSTYRNYIESEIGAQRRDYTASLAKAKKAKERKMWEKNLSDLQNRESELVVILRNNEFQTLSDFERQNELVAELKALGFDGYITTNEIAVL